MKFAKYTFLISGIYGLIILLPQLFLETKIGQDQPPAITHPEFFYGFIGIASVFQIIFLIIAKDPIKYRLLMIPSILEKLSFGIPAFLLYRAARLEGGFFYGGMFDLVLGALFFVSYLKTEKNRFDSH